MDNSRLIQKRGFILAGVLLATFLSAIEGTVIGPAGPTIVSDLGDVSLLSWIFTSYLLTMAVSTPIFGKISDLYGRKPVFMIGVGLFLLGSVLCCFADNMQSLIVFRAIQGIGAGAVVPVTFTIIGDIYSIEERGKVQGMISSVWGISSLLGPLIGGYFVDYLGWPWVFGFNVPFGLLSMWFVGKFLKEDFVRQKVKIDYAGAVTFTIGITSLLIALSLGGHSYPWSSSFIVSLLIVAVVFIAAFLYIETKAKEPIVPLSLFKIRDITMANLAGMLTSALMIGLTSYLPLWIQGVRGGNATTSGLALAPMSIGWLIGGIYAGRLLMKLGSRHTSLIGLTGIIAGSVGLIFMDSHSSEWLLLFYMFVYGLGFGFSFTVFTIIAQSSVGYRQRGASTALNTFMRTLGQTIGAAAFGTWLNSQISAHAQSMNLMEQGVTQKDINSILAPHGSMELPEELKALLQHVLELSLHSLFIIMLIISVGGFIVTAGLRNRPPAPSEEETGQAAASREAT
ncbi:MFS transporter [Neobacillus mesonae]|nr:MFS transporter [Neobacillus mesonae]